MIITGARLFFFSFLFLQQIYKYKLYTISQNLIVNTIFLHFTFFFFNANDFNDCLENAVAETYNIYQFFL